MSLLIFGKQGQVATELTRLVPDAYFVDRSIADLTDQDAISAVIRDTDCEAIINAAAYTAVDRAESEADIAQKVNAEAPSEMAKLAAEKGVPFLHISTDYVFDGSGDKPWAEDDQTGPLGVYGATKLAGEQGIAQAGGQWAVMRTSWVFSAHGANFVKTMLRLGAEREELKVVADQFGGPTPAAAIAAACLKMINAMQDDENKGGMYHFSGNPDTNWSEFAKEIMTQANLPCQITPITTAEYPTPAKRPENSRLNCSKIAADFDISQPDWRSGLTDVLKELAQ